VFFKIIMTTSVTRLQNNTRPARSRQRPRPQCERPRPRTQCARPRLRPRPIFLVSDWSCPKTDGLRPHHCRLRKTPLACIDRA